MENCLLITGYAQLTGHSVEQDPTKAASLPIRIDRE